MYNGMTEIRWIIRLEETEKVLQTRVFLPDMEGNGVGGFTPWRDVQTVVEIKK